MVGFLRLTHKEILIFSLLEEALIFFYYSYLHFTLKVEDI
jgi:hypothetical protein